MLHQLPCINTIRLIIVIPDRQNGKKFRLHFFPQIALTNTIITQSFIPGNSILRCNRCLTITGVDIPLLARGFYHQLRRSKDPHQGRFQSKVHGSLLAQCSLDTISNPAHNRNSHRITKGLVPWAIRAFLSWLILPGDGTVTIRKTL